MENEFHEWVESRFFEDEAYVGSGITKEMFNKIIDCGVFDNLQRRNIIVVDTMSHMDNMQIEAIKLIEDYIKEQPVDKVENNKCYKSNNWKKKKFYD